jgi:predicted negative regulator of RcsB-dependent stress response
MQEAREIFNARVDASLKAPAEGVYPSEAAKSEAALKAFAKVEQEFGSAAEGRQAAYYKGVCQRELGRPADAEKTFRSLLPDGDDPFFTQVVKLALAETLRVQGKHDEALRLLDEVGKIPTAAISSESVAYAKSICLEEKGSVKEAYEILKATKASLDERRKSEEYFSPYESAITSRMEILKARLDSAQPDRS